MLTEAGIWLILGSPLPQSPFSRFTAPLAPSDTIASASYSPPILATLKIPLLIFLLASATAAAVFLHRKSSNAYTSDSADSDLIQYNEEERLKHPPRDIWTIFPSELEKPQIHLYKILERNFGRTKAGCEEEIVAPYLTSDTTST